MLIFLLKLFFSAVFFYFLGALSAIIYHLISDYFKNKPP